MLPEKTRLTVTLTLLLSGLLAQQAHAQYPYSPYFPERPSAPDTRPGAGDRDWAIAPSRPENLPTYQPSGTWIPPFEPPKGGQGGNYTPPIPRPIESPLRHALSKLDPAAKEAALAQLAGADYAHLANATLASTRRVGDSALAAMRLGAAEPSGLSGHGSTRPGESRLWLQSLNSAGQFEQTQGRKDFEHGSKGLVLGADWSLGEAWRLGLLGGKSRSTLEGSRFKGELDNWHLGAYALRQSGPAALRLGVIHSDHDGHTRRSVAFSGYQDRLASDYSATSQQAFAEFGYTLGSARLSVEPFAGLGYERYTGKAHREKGGEAKLDNSAQRQDNFSTTLGLRAASVLRLDHGLSLTPHLSAGWKHLYGEPGGSTRQTNRVIGRTFSNPGIAQDRDRLAIGAGLDLNLSAGHAIGIAYTGEMGQDSRSHGITGQWQMAF